MESKKDEREGKKSKNTTSRTRKSTEKTGTKTKTKKEEAKIATTENKPKKSETKVTKTESKPKRNEAKVEKVDSKIKNDEATIKTSTEPKRKAGKTFLSFIWNIFVKILTIAIIFICIIIVVQKVTNNAESFLGFRIFRVQTGSMIPKYQVGDVILVKEVDPQKIQIGDDVTYKGETGSMQGLLVTHRVIDIEEVDGKRVFHTKGIANNQEDPVVSEDQINGVVQTKMYILSLICMLLNNKYVFYFCGILPLTIYVAFRIFKGKTTKRVRREN